MATGRVKWQTLTGVEGVEGEELKGRQSLLRYMFTGLLTVEVTWTRRKGTAVSAETDLHLEGCCGSHITCTLNST